MYGVILNGGVVLAGLLGLAVTVMALPVTLRDLWGALTGKEDQ